MARQPILVVEDEAIVRESLKDWLQDDGYEVDTAEDGEQALEVIAKKDFGVVVLDLKLPGKDGVQVLKEAKAQRPSLKVVIITAYPSVETATEAMKSGAIDYIPKPFSPEDLERVLEGILTPKGKVVSTEAAIGHKVAQIASREEQIATHKEAGQALLKQGKPAEALAEFEKILITDPGDLEARALVAKAKRGLAKPEAVTAEGEEATAAKECLWMKMGVISYRICTRDYDCLTCDFDQMMQEQARSGGSPEMAEAIERLKAVPGSQRLCRYALKGDVSYRLCSRVYQCATCPFDQSMQDAMDQKYARLEARRAALRKREEKTKAKG